MLVLTSLPLLKYFSCLRCHTVHTPVSLAVPVADGNGEPAEVGPDDGDDAVQARPVAVFARDGHVLALATVVRLVEGSIWTST